ncbi:MAG TPA: hypothetical protein VFH67_01130 [bacterium]|nr:hypothetical protein [bacterium]
MKISGALVEALVNLLKSIGLVDDPEEEIETRRALADLQKTQAQVWVEFVKATTPDSNRVYIWTNSLIALVRPAISTLVACGMIFAPERILELVRTFGEAGPAGWIVVAPLLWWFFGRDVNKVLAMHYGGLIQVGSGAAEPGPIDSRAPDVEELRKETRDLINELKERMELPVPGTSER